MCFAYIRGRVDPNGRVASSCAARYVVPGAYFTCTVEREIVAFIQHTCCMVHCCGAKQVSSSATNPLSKRKISPLTCPAGYPSSKTSLPPVRSPRTAEECNPSDCPQLCSPAEAAPSPFPIPARLTLLATSGLARKGQRHQSLSHQYCWRRKVCLSGCLTEYMLAGQRQSCSLSRELRQCET